ncbi:MAG TPA: SDR family oxidoreductase [Thermoleophilaceae bacterium]|nr:SDR family oxidoreductase [Thermoleophilaceae bacterium]
MSSPSWPLAGKVVFLTGAARGIGAESARRLAASGMKIALVGLEPEELAKVAAECGPDAAWFEADVTDRDQLQAAVDGTVERFGGIDAVIANAGIAIGAPVRLADPESFERVIEVNLFGAYRTVHACLPQIVQRKGYVLIVASMAAIFHAPGMAAYSASKAGVEAFANSLRVELAHHGARVGVGYFSWIDTEMVRGADRHPALGAMRAKLPAAARKTYPVSAVGDAVVAGFEQRARWVGVPLWMIRLSLPLRGLLTRLTERGARDSYPEMEAAFERDIVDRGVEAASQPSGAGGAAALTRD